MPVCRKYDYTKELKLGSSIYAFSRVYHTKTAMCCNMIKGQFGCAFEGPKSAFNTQKVYLKKKVPVW
jgi:hypothetical protein